MGEESWDLGHCGRGTVVPGIYDAYFQCVCIITRICRHMRGVCDRKRVRNHSEALALPAANLELQYIGMGSNEERAFSRMIRNSVLTSQA